MLKTERLERIAELIRTYFPLCGTIGCFARITDVIHLPGHPLHGPGLEQLGLPEVGLDILQRRHAEGEGQIVVQG